MEDRAGLPGFLLGIRQIQREFGLHAREVSVPARDSLAQCLRSDPDNTDVQAQYRLGSSHTLRLLEGATRLPECHTQVA